MEKADAITEKNKAMLYMVLCGIMWSIGGILIKLVNWNPLLIAGLRSVFSGSVLLIFMTCNNVKIKVCKNSVLAGLSLGLMATSFVAANKFTSAANAIVLQYSSPIFIIILSVVFFHEKIGFKEIKVVFLAMVGMVLFFLDQLSAGNIIGNSIAIFSGVCMASMFVLTGRKENDESTRLSGILFSNVFVTTVGLIGLIIFGIPEVVYAKEVISVISMGVFQLGIPYVFYARASKTLTPLTCSLIGMLEPLLNPVWVAIFAKEVPGLYAFLGAVIILSTMTWWSIKNQ